MTEVTRVPLQPIAKGSLTKLWLGLAFVVLAALAIAWFSARAQGVAIETITAGEGESPTVEDVVFVHYTGKLADGTVFDQSPDSQWPVPGILPEGAPLQLEAMIPGFRDALLKMQRGGKYTIEIPSEMGYGSTPPAGSPIPPDADLVFDIELVDFMAVEEAEQRYQAMVQAMQQMGPPPAPDGAGADPQ